MNPTGKAGGLPIAFGRSHEKISPAPSKPATNAARHVLSSPAERNSPPKIPLMPAILPFSSSNREAEAPMSTPPSVDAMGVKFDMNQNLRRRWSGRELI
jgi:hypothetical protein